ncbi:M28 family metallopeptidase [Flavobacteriaceae bacterium]|nr:M28 family metallopeptidase [Flavobacteriaceae bacterium]
MFKHVLVALLVATTISSCGTGKTSEKKDLALQYSNSIKVDDLKSYLYTLADDDMEGRNTGEAGQKKAAEYLKNFYVENGIESPLSGDDYFQEIPASFLRGRAKASENVVAFIKGSEKPEEILVISAHYDHVGMKGDAIYNGADDDASGTSAVMEIAQAFKMAEKDGNGPKRSILFINLTAEEKGLFGSKWYVSHPIFPLENTVANLNIDMVGRVDKAHETKSNYVYLIGSDKLSSELHNLSEQANKKYTHLDLDYTYNDEEDPNRFYYRSDHYNFAKNNIPIIFYFNGVHDDYHQPSDTPDKIDYVLLEKRAKLVFFTAWDLANRETAPALD